MMWGEWSHPGGKVARAWPLDDLEDKSERF